MKKESQFSGNKEKRSIDEDMMNQNSSLMEKYTELENFIPFDLAELKEIYLGQFPGEDEFAEKWATHIKSVI